jgi:hypothetical protein
LAAVVGSVQDFSRKPPCFFEILIVERKMMGNRPAGYWILVLIAIALGVAGFIMRSSPDPHNRAIAQYFGWGAIALLLIARFFFRGKPDNTPPMPKD